MTDWLSMLQDHWAWLVFAALLAIAEVLIPGVFLIWIAIAAAITGLAALALPIGIPLQLLIFAALCVVSVWAGRRWYVDNPVPSTDTIFMFGGRSGIDQLLALGICEP